mmetsp:Transcript_451/g.1493  ORF Transcript_451/g.1493 Transcript_451/m.1493 type:complete len:231 (-) Transcript_451:959-1651(-)
MLPAQKALAPTMAALASNSKGLSQRASIHNGFNSLANQRPNKAPITKVGTIAPTGKGSANTTAAVANFVMNAKANSTSSSAVSLTPSLAETNLLSSKAGDSSLSKGCSHKRTEFTSATAASKSTTFSTLWLLATCSAQSSTFMANVCITMSSSPGGLPSCPALEALAPHATSIEAALSRARLMEPTLSIAVGSLRLPDGTEQHHRTSLERRAWLLIKAAPSTPQSTPKRL